MEVLVKCIDENHDNSTNRLQSKVYHSQSMNLTSPQGDNNI